ADVVAVEIGVNDDDPDPVPVGVVRLDGEVEGPDHHLLLVRPPEVAERLAAAVAAGHAHGPPGAAGPSHRAHAAPHHHAHHAAAEPLTLLVHHALHTAAHHAAHGAHALVLGLLGELALLLGDQAGEVDLLPEAGGEERQRVDQSGREDGVGG